MTTPVFSLAPIMKTINLGIFAHIDAGKTTLTERILHIAGVIPSPGTIQEGTTESDTLLVEIEKGISVLSSLIQFDASKISPGLKINLLDTPGHLDFRSQVESVLDCIDIAVVVIDGSRGVESQTLLLHQELSDKNIPEIFFINKLDRAEDQLSDTLVSLEELLGRTPIIPFHEKDYSYLWKNPELFTERQHLEILEWSDELSSEYILSPENLYSISIKALYDGIASSKLFPVLGGSAYFGKGVEELLELISGLNFQIPDSLPGESIILSKRMVHPELGRLTIARALKDFQEGAVMEVKGQKVPINRIVHLAGDRWSDSSQVSRGDLFATADLNQFMPINREADSNFIVILEAYSPEDSGELWDVLIELTWEDPSYIVKKNPETGNIQLYGRGELHLEVARHRLEENFKKNYSIGEYSVARYELLKRMEKKLALEHIAFDEKLSSGKLVANLRDTADFSKRIAFEVSLPEKIQNAITTGFHETMSRGNYHLELMGLELVVESYDEPAILSEKIPSLLKVAVVSGLRNSLLDQTVMIGPVSDLEITVDDSYVGNVLSLLQKREGQIGDIRKSFSGKSLIIARAGTENLLGFSGALRNMTKGTGISYQRNSFNPENYIVLNESKPR